jgi:hypothetical protein
MVQVVISQDVYAASDPGKSRHAVEVFQVRADNVQITVHRGHCRQATKIHQFPGVRDKQIPAYVAQAVQPLDALEFRNQPDKQL